MQTRSQPFRIMTHLALCSAGVAFSMISTGVLFAAEKSADKKAEKNVPIQISGGHETDPRDGGRPVVLVAAGLGVATEVFREAFRGVTPSRNGPPSGSEARANKEALMRVLRPYGITNDRLDEVSNHYRYQPQRGDLWRNTPAEGYAVIEGGKIAKVVVTNPGSGYSSVPKIMVSGHDSSALKATLHFETDLSKNGSIESVEVTSSRKR